jgi:hypothetical protein
VKPPEDPLTSLGSNLACALLAQLLNVMLAAVLAAQVPGGYRVRSWVFLAAVLWSLGGTVLLLVGTTRGVARNGAPGIRVGRVGLWLASAWLWPILVRWRRRS